MGIFPSRFVRTALAIGVFVTPFHVHAQDITSGLVGHWTLDETSGSSIADLAGSNTGTWVDSVNNDVAEETITGQLRSAINFDGVDDYIEIPQSSDLNVQDTVTLALWVKAVPGSNDYTRLITKNNNVTPYGFDIQQQVNGTNIELRVDTLTGGATSVAGISGVLDDTWHHIVYVIDRGNVASYLDGAPNSTGTYTHDGTGFGNSLDLTLGAHDNKTQDWLEGALDDVRFYNRALTAADVSTLYTHRVAEISCSNPDGITGEMFFNADTEAMQYCNGTQWAAIGSKQSQPSGLIGHWTFDETSGSLLSDSSASNLDATWSDNDDNDVSGETSAGKVDRALTLDGVDDYIDAGSDAIFDNIPSLSVCSWVYRTSVPDAYATIADKSSDGYNGWNFYMNNSGLLGFYSNLRGYVEIPNQLDLNTWVHVCSTWDGTEGAAGITLYKNGVALAPSSSGDLGAALDDSAFNLTFGSVTAGTSRFGGGLDDMRIYNRALSAAEVTSIYNLQTTCTASTAGLVGHWTLDETSGSSIADSAGSNTGTWVDNANNDVAEETVAGQDATSLTFDGADDAINVGSDVSIDDIFSGGGTVSAWIHPTSGGSGTYGRIMDKSQSTSANNGWALQIDDGLGDIGFEAGCSSGAYYWQTNSAPAPFNQWSHIAIVFDNSDITNDPMFYVNGNIASIVNNGGGCSGSFDSDAASNLIIGDYQGGARPFDGIIDDVRLYNRAISASEVASMYGATGGTCTASNCSAPFGLGGEIVYNADHHVMQYCNTREWVAMGQAGNGGAGCTNPTGGAAELRYNTDFNTLQYCEGDEWVAVISEVLGSIPTANLVGHWTLDETSGNLINDSSPSNIDGTWNDSDDNDVSSEATAGQVNGALTFDNTDDVISLGDNLDLTGAITLCGWAKPTGSTSGYIIGKFDQSTSTGYFLRASGTAWIMGNDATDFINVGGSVDYDTWQHMCAVLNPSPQTSSLYKNGVSIGSNTTTPAHAPNAVDLTIGNSYLNNRDFGGELDDVRVYDRGLSAIEINNLYKATR